MKPWPFLLIIALALFIAACADPMEQRSGSEVQSQLQRGVTGQGQLGPEQREHGIPQTDP